MSVGTAVALVLALVSTTLINLAYLREHDAAAELPVLSMRRPLHSAGLLLSERSWLIGFAMESVGFLLYAAALALAELALVQSIAAGGIGVLAFASARLARRRLRRRELIGVLISIFGLAALGLSLAGGSSPAGQGTTASILLWLSVTAGAAIVIVLPGRRLVGVAVAYGIAGGLLFSIGDIATKVTTEGGMRLGFLIALIIGYTGGTALLQVGYQAGGALTVAGIATLLTNALPIAAGTIILDEPVPPGAFGALRVIAFAAVITGSVLLARPDKPSKTRPPHRAADASSSRSGA
jgi:drug/metabolite transporter (DMT)-like permease